MVDADLLELAVVLGDLELVAGLLDDEPAARAGLRRPVADESSPAVVVVSGAAGRSTRVRPRRRRWRARRGATPTRARRRRRRVLRPCVMRSVGWVGGGGGAARARRRHHPRGAGVGAGHDLRLALARRAASRCVASSGGVTRVSSVSSSGSLPVLLVVHARPPRRVTLVRRQWFDSTTLPNSAGSLFQRGPEVEEAWGRSWRRSPGPRSRSRGRAGPARRTPWRCGGRRAGRSRRRAGVHGNTRSQSGPDSVVTPVRRRFSSIAAMRSDSLRRTLPMPVIVTGEVASGAMAASVMKVSGDVGHVDGEAGQRSRAGHAHALGLVASPCSPSPRARRGTRRRPAGRAARCRPSTWTAPPVTAAAAKKYDAVEASGSTSYSRPA